MSHEVIEGPILAFDIVGYSLRPIDDQMDVQQLSSQLLIRSCEGVSVRILGQEWVDAGDGGFLLLQGDIRAALYAVQAMVPLLEKENRRRVQEHRVEMRFAMHFGLVRRWSDTRGTKLAGDAINETARLLNGMSRKHSGQVVCSGKYYRRLVHHADEPEGLFLRLHDVVDKHGGRHEMWNVRRIPGYGVEPTPDELFRDESQLEAQRAEAARQEALAADAERDAEKTRRESEQADAERAKTAKAEQKRVKAAKDAADRAEAKRQADLAEQEATRVSAQRAEQDRLAREKAEAEREATRRAEADRAQAEKAREAERRESERRQKAEADAARNDAIIRETLRLEAKKEAERMERARLAEAAAKAEQEAAQQAERIASVPPPVPKRFSSGQMMGAGLGAVALLGMAGWMIRKPDAATPAQVSDPSKPFPLWVTGVWGVNGDCTDKLTIYRNNSDTDKIQVMHEGSSAQEVWLIQYPWTYELLQTDGPHYTKVGNNELKVLDGGVRYRLTKCGFRAN